MKEGKGEDSNRRKYDRAVRAETGCLGNWLECEAAGNR
jgi:hypothetical protein